MCNVTKTLYVFPYAGGNSSAFVPLANLCAGYCKIELLDYPGHGKLYCEDFAKSISDLANRCTNYILQHYCGNSIYLLGYSMGCIVAYEVAKRLQDKGVCVAHVFYLAGDPPSVESALKYAWNTDKELIDELVALGGIPEEFISNAELLEYFLPIIKNDCKLMNEYTDLNPTMILSRCSVLFSNEEKLSGRIKEWDEYGEDVTYIFFDDCHFFIFNYLDSVADYILNIIQTK